MKTYISILLFFLAHEAYSRPTLVQEVEVSFQKYTKDMETMQQKCIGGSKTKGLKCMCSHIGSLLAFKELVVKAAGQYPNESVTLRAKGTAKSIKLVELVKSLEETKKLVTLCANPEQSSQGLQAFAIKAKQAVAKARLSHLYTIQQMQMADTDSYVAFPPMGAGEKNCSSEKLSIDLGECSAGPYRYSISVSQNGKRFKAEARTLVGDQNALFPGCKTADVWTIDEKKQLSHVVDASASCLTD